MTNKEKIQRLVNRFDDDVPYDVALERLSLLQDIEAGLKDIEEGHVIDHDTLMAELEAENEEIQARVDRSSNKQSPGDKGQHLSIAVSSPSPAWPCHLTESFNQL